MLYKFKSKAGSDVIMMGPHGDDVLRAIGRDPAPQGILECIDMPQAMSALEQCIAAEEAARQRADAEAALVGLAPVHEGVTLRQRAWPLLDLIRRSHAAEHPVTWGH